MHGLSDYRPVHVAEQLATTITADLISSLRKNNTDVGMKLCIFYICPRGRVVNATESQTISIGPKRPGFDPGKLRLPVWSGGNE